LHRNLNIIALLVILLGSQLNAEVEDIIIFTSGEAVIGRILSFTDNELILLALSESEPDTIPLSQVYFAYNHFGKILHFSRSLSDRLEYIEHYSGYLITTQDDTIYYQQIYFDQRNTDPLAYLTVETGFAPIRIPFLEIELIRMSAERFEASVKRGGISGCSTLLLLSGMSTMLYFTEDYAGEGIFTASGLTTMGNSASKSITDFLPELSFIGLNKQGKSYPLATMILPASTLSWMAYDWYFDKRTVYLNPIKTNQPFPANMFYFSLTEWSDNLFRKLWTPLSRKTLDQIYKARKAIWKG